MKKLIYTLAAALIGVCACTRSDFEGPKPQAKESGMVAVTMSVTVPVDLAATTKAGERSVNPDIEYLKVAVFGTSGYPQAYALAEPVNKIVDEQGNTTYTTDGAKYADENDTKFYFKVLLPVYEGEAHVHIIGNGDEYITFDEGVTEDSIMFQMKTAEDRGAFWASVILEDGILADLDSNGIMKTDEDGNFIPSNETAQMFKDLVLVRNFAQVTLELNSAVDNLFDVTWALVNVPTSGSVAPIAPVKGEDGKVENDYVYDYKLYTFDTNDGLMKYNGNTYAGYMIDSDVNTDIPAESAITTSINTPLFVYERVDPDNTNPTAILLKARYGSNEAKFSYYRIDLMAESLGGYFPLYRNYKYQIKINRVGSAGSSSPEEAMLHESGGNVSMSAEAKTLTDISDGISRLYVEFVEKTYTTGGEKEFWVYYVPDVSTGDIDNTKISVKIKDQGTALVEGSSIVLDEDKSSDTGNVDDAIVPMRFYKFQVNGQSETVDLQSVIQIKASNEAADEANLSTLYRDITVKVLKTMDISLSLSKASIAKGKDETTVLSISLKDELPQSMFPLEIYIEDTNRTLNPTGKDGNGNTIEVPVKTGASLYNSSDKHSYYFVRTVNYSEYQALYEAAAGGTYSFTTEFKTIKDESATTIYVDNEYFNMMSVELTNSN